MSFHILRNLEEIALLRKSWNRIAGNNPFHSWEWHYCWYKHFAQLKRPLVVFEKIPGQEVSVIAPLYSQKSTFRLNRVGLAGDGSACTDNSQFIADPKQQCYSIAKMVRWITESKEAASFDVFDFDGLSVGSAATQEMVSELATTGIELGFQKLESCWVVKLEDNWDSQNATFSKKHRRKTKKAVKNLANCDVLSLSTHDFEQLWPQFVRLHQLRRQSLGEPGCFADERFEGFLKEAVQGLSKRGLAEILVVEFEGQPFAATLLFSDSFTTYMYQTGFDPDFSRLEPGYILIVAAMQMAIELRHGRFDFMRGDEPYKARWMAKPENMVRMRFQLNNGLRVQLINGLRWSRTIAKGAAKAALQTTKLICA